MKMMNTYACTSICLALLCFVVTIQSQRSDDRDLPPERQQASRKLKQSFESQFSRGRCPNRFYQLGDECVYPATDGKSYTWQQAERVCSKRIARMLEQYSSSGQPNQQPKKGVRQLVLNTPEKTDFLRAMNNEYNEQNYAVRLPSDYDTLTRCRDGNDDRWPDYCANTPRTNQTCFETFSPSGKDLCLRQVECDREYLRLACEFTLPGSTELTESKFRTCPKSRGFRRRLPLWAWILIIATGSALLLGLIGGIATCARKGKKGDARPKRTLPEPRPTDVHVVRVKAETPSDPAAEPMLIRPAPSAVEDTGYLQPRSTERPLPPIPGSATNA